MSSPGPMSTCSSLATLDSSHAGKGSYSWSEKVRCMRLLEFGCTLLMIGIAAAFSKIKVHMRDIPNVEVQLNSTYSIFARDPTLNNKELTQQVSMIEVGVIGMLVPIVTNLVINYGLPHVKRVRTIAHDTRDFLLSLMLSVGLSQLLTQFIKNMTGRFRPCFYDMCGWQFDVVWDGTTNLCTNSAHEQEARKSFPSGHASFSWATMLLLTLYLLGRSRLNCENRSETMLRGGRKMTKLALCFLPSFLATWVAVTRSVDNWHHYSDILAGSIIGAASACIGYGYNYDSVFSENAGMPSQEIHNRRKMKELERQTATSSSKTSLSMHQLV